MSNERSVVFVTSSMRLSGGVLVLIHLTNGLLAHGYRVTFVTSAGDTEPEIEERLAPQVQVLSAQLSMEEASSWLGKVRLSWQMAQLVPRCNTIVATHTPAVIPALLARHLLRRAQSTVWFHQDYAEMFEKRPIELWIMQHAPRWFGRVITVSQASQEEIMRTSGMKAWVVPQGFSLSADDTLPVQATERPASKIVLYVGDRRPRKGWDDFLEATALLHTQHPDLRLAIVSKEAGSVDTPVPYQIYVRPSWEEFVEICQSCGVFVSASWWESFGRPPLEAMACGAPVVVTDSRGVREYARDGFNCLMTPIQDPVALATAIDRVLSDESLARRLSEAGRQTGRQFTWKRAVDCFIHALEAEG